MSFSADQFNSLAYEASTLDLSSLSISSSRDAVEASSTCSMGWGNRETRQAYTSLSDLSPDAHVNQTSLIQEGNAQQRLRNGQPASSRVCAKEEEAIIVF